MMNPKVRFYFGLSLMIFPLHKTNKLDVNNNKTQQVNNYAPAHLNSR